MLSKYFHRGVLSSSPSFLDREHVLWRDRMASRTGISLVAFHSYCRKSAVKFFTSSNPFAFRRDVFIFFMVLFIFICLIIFSVFRA